MTIRLQLLTPTTLRVELEGGEKNLIESIVLNVRDSEGSVSYADLGRFLLGLLTIKSAHLFACNIDVIHSAYEDIGAVQTAETDFLRYLSLWMRARESGDPALLFESHRLLKRSANAGLPMACERLKNWKYTEANFLESLGETEGRKNEDIRDSTDGEP